MFVVVNPVQRDSCPAVTPNAPASEVVGMMTAMQVDLLWVVDPHGGTLGVITMAGLVRSGDPGDDPIFAGRARRRWWELPPCATARDLMTPVPAPGPAAIGYDHRANRVSPDAA